MSPESAVRFGSARRRTTPRSSSACTSASACTPLPSMLPTHGAERRGARDAARRCRPRRRRRRRRSSRFCCTTCQLTPSSRPAERDASTKRTSSITCCGAFTFTELITSAPNCLAMVIALSTVTAFGRAAAEHDAAVDRGDAEARMREALRQLAAEPRGVVGHLDVVHADQLLALAVDRDARGADLLAEDRERAVGERDRVGDLRIADDHLREAAFAAHALGLADRDPARSRRCGPPSARPRAPATGAVATPSGKRAQRSACQRCRRNGASSRRRAIALSGRQAAPVLCSPCPPLPHSVFQRRTAASVLRCAFAPFALSSAGTLYSCRFAARVTETLVKRFAFRRALDHLGLR